MQTVITLENTIKKARNDGRAVPHFNISTVEMFWAIVKKAKEKNAPVVIGVSEGERDFLGLKTVVALVDNARTDFGIEIYLNADHTYSVERVKEAIDAGFDSVIFDGAKLSFEENIAKAKECVAYAKQSGRDVLVEGELGYIGSSSKLLTEIPDGAIVKEEDMTKVEDATHFVNETGINLFSPAVGSIHGMLGKGRDPDLNIERIEEISSALSVPIVLHGASGLSDSNIKAAIRAGIAMIHVSTELRDAWKRALKFSLQEDENEVAPYKILKAPMLAVEKVVEEKLTLFGW